MAENYVLTLDRLRQSFLAQPQIAYFSAFGRRNAPAWKQEENRHSVVEMGPIWGFALRQSHWKAMQPLLAPYYEIVCGRDYRQRPHDEIRELFRTWGISKMQSSQDSAKDLVTNHLGCWRASTFVCLAKYIGEFGTHSDTSVFEAGRFTSVFVFEGKVPNRFEVSDAQIEAAIQVRRAIWRVECDRQVRELAGIGHIAGVWKKLLRLFGVSTERGTGPSL